MMAKRKRLDVLTNHRLKKIVCELQEILESASLKKTDVWDLQQASDMIKDILGGDMEKKKEPESGAGG